MISTIILTKNESRDLPRCLESLHWCDDVHVLDSGSTDETTDIARKAGVTVSQNKFESFGRQRNFALDHLNTKHDWILFLDADEIATEEFQKALRKAVGSCDPNVAGYYCCWKMILEDRWLKRCDGFPKWQFRLLRKGRARFTDFGHGQKETDVDGDIMFLREPYLHFGFSKGWTQWIERHNVYSTQEAIARSSQNLSLQRLKSRNPSIRNPALKVLLTRLPGWPLLRFFQAYCLKLGFLEGVPGFVYCVNIAYYEFLVQIKIREMKKSESLSFD